MNGLDEHVGSSVVFKLTKTGGPDPVRELERVAGVAEESGNEDAWNGEPFVIER